MAEFNDRRPQVQPAAGQQYRPSPPRQAKWSSPLGTANYSKRGALLSSMSRSSNAANWPPRAL